MILHTTVFRSHSLPIADASSIHRLNECCLIKIQILNLESCVRFVKLSFILRTQFHCLLRLPSLILIFNYIVLLLSSLPHLPSFALSHSVQWQLWVSRFIHLFLWLNLFQHIEMAQIIFGLQFHLVRHCTRILLFLIIIKY